MSKAKEDILTKIDDMISLALMGRPVNHRKGDFPWETPVSDPVLEFLLEEIHELAQASKSVMKGASYHIRSSQSILDGVAKGKSADIYTGPVQLDLLDGAVARRHEARHRVRRARELLVRVNGWDEA